MTEVAQATDAIRLPITDTTLANGLRVVIFPKHSASVVNITVAYKVGSKDESHDNKGFAHLFEHLMFEGSENVAHGEFDRLCTEAGGDNNAYTNSDKTTYYLNLPSSQLELGLWLEADRMSKFGVDQESLNIQQNVVTEEINQNVENRPYGKFSEIQSAMAFAPACAYNWDTYGDVKHVAASTLEQVKHFNETFYRPDNACLVICGDVYPARALELAEKYFSIIPKGKSPVKRNEFRSSFLLGNQYRLVQDNVPFNSVCLSYHFDGFASDEFFAAEVLGSILSDGNSSRLYNALVYDQKIAAEVSAYSDDREWSSLFNVQVVGNDKSITAEKLNTSVLKILSEIAESGVNENEVAKAQNRLSTSIAQQHLRCSGISDEIAHQTLFYGNPNRTFSLADSVNAVTIADVQKLAQKLFRVENQIRIDFVPKTEK